MYGAVINGERYPSIMTPMFTSMTAMQDAKFKLTGPIPGINSSAFGKDGNIDPDKRKVYQRDIDNVLRNYNPSLGNSIGGKSQYLYDSNGYAVKLKL